MGERFAHRAGAGSQTKAPANYRVQSRAGLLMLGETTKRAVGRRERGGRREGGGGGERGGEERGGRGGEGRVGEVVVEGRGRREEVSGPAKRKYHTPRVGKPGEEAKIQAPGLRL